MKVHAVILAAGVSSRFEGNKNKILSTYKEKALIQYLLETYTRSNIFNTILLLVNTKEKIFLEEIITKNTALIDVVILEGGETRHGSEEKALDYIEKSLSGLLEPDIKETVIGSEEIQKIFKVSNAETCLVAFKNNNLTGFLIFVFIFSFNIL